MTREEIIKLAHKTDCLDPQHYGSLWIDRLVTFANLILQSKPKWVGLEEESLSMVTDEFYAGAVWAEAKLKEKNT